jgi:hypothetical protein
MERHLPEPEVGSVFEEAFARVVGYSARRNRAPSLVVPHSPVVQDRDIPAPSLVVAVVGGDVVDHPDPKNRTGLSGLASLALHSLD